MTWWSNVLVPVTSMMITVFATIYTVSKRVENENKEKHKPYLTLNNIDPLEKIDEYKYYLTLFGKKRNIVSENDEQKNKETTSMSVTLSLNNIGYGVASNIKFYNLSTGDLIKGDQSYTKSKNQKLYTTFDIAMNTEKQVQAKIFDISENEDNENDNFKILCIYQDLNGNIYDFIIKLNIKSNKTYDFSIYQRTSHSYARCVKENKQEYKKIVNNYKK